MGYWGRGDPVVRRTIWFGHVTNAKPLTVVSDSPDLVALYLAPETRFKIASAGGRMEYIRALAAHRHAEPSDDTWTGTHALVLTRPGDAYSIWAFWPQIGGELLTWYVNLERPAVRSGIGLDTADLFLDVVIAPDLAWEWKDEDELQEAERTGLLSTEEAHEVRSEGERVIRLIEAGDAWWLEWHDWTPDPDWPVPSLPAGWADVG